MVNDTYIPGQRLAQAIARGEVDPAKVIMSLLPPLPHETGGIPIPLPRMLFSGAQAAPAVQTYPVPEQVIPPPTAAPEVAPAPQQEIQPPASPQPVISRTKRLTMDELASPNHQAKSGYIAIKQIL